MRSRRETVLSFLSPTKPLPRSVASRPRIRAREAVAYLLTFALALVIVGISLRWHIGGLYEEQMAAWRARQLGVADDQAQRVSDWLKERQGDAQLFAASPALGALFRGHYEAGKTPNYGSIGLTGSLAVLDELAKRYSYSGVYVVDRDSRLVLQSRQSIPLNPLFSETCRAVSQSGAMRIALVGEAPDGIQMGFGAPVLLGAAASSEDRRPGQVLGMVLLVSEASRALFPLVTRESIPTRTSETDLVRREGNAIVYFSPLRLAPAGSPPLRFPLSTAPLMARLALAGGETFLEDIDYRGVPVLAATQHIPLAGWGLVRKIDRAEAMKGFRRLANAQWLTAGLRLILLGGLLLFHRQHVLTRELKQEEKKFQALLESSPDAMIVVGRTGHIEFVNSATERMFGYEPKELLGQSALTLIPETFRAERAEYYSRLFSNPALHDQQMQQDRWGLRKDGTEFPVEVTSSTIETLQGAVVAIAVRDITERRRTDDALIEERHFLHTLMDNLPDLIYFKDSEGHFTRINKALAKEYGLSGPAEAIGKTDFEFTAAEYAKGFYEDEQRIILTGQPVVDKEEGGMRADGHVRWVSTTKMPLRDAIGNIIGTFGVSRDITERKRAEAEHVRLVTAIEQSAEAVMITTTNGNIEYVNPAFTSITGYNREEVLGLSPRILKSDKQDSEFFRQLWATILRGETWLGEIINRRKDGTLYTENLTIAPVRSARGEVTHFIATMQDVTERKSLEEHVRQVAKMEAIGRLAGGVAHDFNNLLTVINGYAELLLEKFASDHPTSAHLKEMLKAGERAASLTFQLLAFSRRQVLAPQVLDLNAVVSNLGNMLLRLISEDIKLRTVLDPSLRRVKADPGQIEQVIVNLAVNARDAMPLGGNLTIETSNVELDESFARSHGTVKPGPHVMLAVADTGVGMTPEIQAHIFEPFFTLKEKGKGTGLGLATVYGIVKQSGGSIWVYSEPDQGAVFKIYLPVVGESQAADGYANTEMGAAHGTETILVVEDEKGVRSLIRLALESTGYKVLETDDGESALETCASHDGPIHLLLTDVVMPRMSGPLVAEKAKALRPNLKVIYMSGYTDDAVVRHGVLSHDMSFIQKPFSPTALRRKVREALDH